MLFICLISFSLFAQKKDTLYVESFSHKINIKTSLETEGQSLDLINQNTLDNYSLMQNEVGKLALSLNYKIIGLKLGFSPKFLENDASLKGATEYRHYRVQLFFPKLYHQFYYYRTKGFYIKNTDDYVDNWKEGEDPYLQLTNLNTREIGGETRYYFSNKFGYRAIFSNTERQIKSKGTWLATVKYYYSKINKPTTDYFILNDRSYNFNLSGGYVYNLVVNQNKYLFAQVTPSVGVRYIKATHDDSDGDSVKEDYFVPNIGLKSRFGFGYSSKTFYYGVSILVNSLAYSEYPNVDLVDTRIFASVHLGYRFDAFKGVERFFKKLNL
ncbi:DUF4421 family protein [Wenyingzhuangia sp. 2_MG-2023]|uniref:DUF4421 family protein n=1 Tax=Wenyingzhuangia sp. 2_MG-2023 TaxID=3062639 RepID=UPI0026E29944|nr:DUF4421 family protein [Wenyingzhuangia sp. 2_MG-2023]MDO6739070.1 DUF4421 family protein [Wenyingzhuangia sp. 2_MG-2023]